MADCPTDLGAPAVSPPKPPRPPAIDGTALEPPERGGEYELNAMVWLAHEIAAGRKVRARVPEATLVMALAMTVVKLAEDRG